MAVKGQVVDVYKEGTQTNWGNVIIWLSLAFLIMQMIGIALTYYLFDKESARTAFLIIAAVDGVLLIIGVAVGIYHLASRNMARAIAEHDRTDSEGDEAKIAAVLHGAAAITGAQANGHRQQVAAEALGLKWTQMTMREANRLANERAKAPPPADDDLLKQLLGGDEPLLLTDGDDE